MGALTSGIYVPTTVEVRCSSGRRADLELDADDVRRIVSDPEFLQWVAAVAPARLEDAAEAQAELLD